MSSFMGIPVPSRKEVITRLSFPYYFWNSALLSSYVIIRRYALDTQERGKYVRVRPIRCIYFIWKLSKNPEIYSTPLQLSFKNMHWIILIINTYFTIAPFDLPFCLPIQLLNYRRSNRRLLCCSLRYRWRCIIVTDQYETASVRL